MTRIETNTPVEVMVNLHDAVTLVYGGAMSMTINHTEEWTEFESDNATIESITNEIVSNRVDKTLSQNGAEVSILEASGDYDYVIFSEGVVVDSSATSGKLGSADGYSFSLPSGAYRITIFNEVGEFATGEFTIA